MGSSATADAPSFNPFNDRPETDIGRRESHRGPVHRREQAPGALPEMSLGRKARARHHRPVRVDDLPLLPQIPVETFPVLKREYIDTGKLRYVLRAGFRSASSRASLPSRCVAPLQTSISRFTEKLMAPRPGSSQEARPDPIFKVAAQVGGTTFDPSCRENFAYDQRAATGVIMWAYARHHRHAANFFIQGKLVKSVIGIREVPAKWWTPILPGRMPSARRASSPLSR